MAKYAAFDTLYKCVHCETEVALHHIDCSKGVRCPNCNHFAFWRADHCQETFAPLPLTAGQAGMFAIRFIGRGSVFLPKITIEEIKWIPANEQPCPVCKDREWHIIHEYNIYDAAHRFGLYQSEGWEMHGVDVIREGSSVYFPFQSDFRIWINDVPVDFARLWSPHINTWEYFL